MVETRVSDGSGASNRAVLANGLEIDTAALATLEATLDRACVRAAALHRAVKDGLRSLGELQAEGVDFARPVYQGNYLYRALPTDGSGKRRREYVGGAGERAIRALASMNRGARYNDQAAALRALVIQTSMAQRHATRLAEYLEAVATL